MASAAAAGSLVIVLVGVDFSCIGFPRGSRNQNPFQGLASAGYYANRVVSYPKAVRLFKKGDIWNLRAAELRRLGVTHAYAAGVPTRAPGCVRLEPDARLDRNPFNNEPFAEPQFYTASSTIVPPLPRISPRIGCARGEPGH
jgi:hypothetical protein